MYISYKYLWYSRLQFMENLLLRGKHTDTHTQTRARVHARTHTYTHIHTHTHTHIHCKYRIVFVPLVKSILWSVDSKWFNHLASSAEVLDHLSSPSITSSFFRRQHRFFLVLFQCPSSLFIWRERQTYKQTEHTDRVTDRQRDDRQTDTDTVTHTDKLTERELVTKTRVSSQFVYLD